MSDINSDPMPRKRQTTVVPEPWHNKHGDTANMLDLTTAVFLMRKTLEEINETLSQMAGALEWWLTYTYGDYTQ